MPDEPRSGACTPWLDASAVKALPKVKEAVAELTKKGLYDPAQFDLFCAIAATAASDALYELSGRVFTGECGPVTVRPQARPTNMDTRAWAGLSSSGWGYNGGLGSSYGAQLPGVVAHYGAVNPPEVDLGVHPVTEIVQVKIDGVVIPASEYELRAHRRLVRLRPADSVPPTQRYGWPTSQIPDLPDTEPGTFSVTFKFGQAPPQLGIVAATKLAEYLMLPMLGDSRHYPQRVTSINRQGVQSMIVDVMDVLKSKSTGIYEVDLFVLTYNPGKQRKQSRVFSPDRGRPRRTANPSA
jgi:hypothetical protein